MIELPVLPASQPQLKALGEHLRESSELLAALADAGRQDLVVLLARNELNVSELAERLPRLSRPTISHHLGVLRRAGLVSARKEGKEVFYRLNKPYITAVLERLLICLNCC